MPTAPPLIYGRLPSEWALKTELAIHRGLAGGPVVGGYDTFCYDGEGRNENKTLILAAEKESVGWLSNLGSGRGKEESDWVARYVARDGKRVDEATKRLEGALEVRRAGLTAQQFEEVFVTLVAEMERKRQDNDDWETVGKVLKHSGGA
ncbi:hypothetical protein N0V88_006255 [Collariella sp. IMI 366227]|nr:hypothetical protein N0V88_006255 [Collariella sp. IMI 366227]